MHGPLSVGSLPKTTWVPSDIAGVVALLRRYWRLLIACALAGIVAMLAATILILGPTYVISAKILVNLGPEMATTPMLKARETGVSAPPTRRPEDSATGVEIFTDPRLIREVVAQLGDDFFADPPPATFVQHIKHAVKATFRLARDLIRETIVAIGLRPPTTRQERLTLAIGAALLVEPVRKTDMISVTLKFPDPRAGEVILERFIAQALSGYLQAYRSSGVTHFFQEGRAARIAELREAEDRLLKFRLSETDPVWSVTDQRPVLIRAEAELRTRLIELRLELSAQQLRYGEGSREISDIRHQIDSVQTEIQGLRGQLQRIETAAVEIGVLEQNVARLRRALDVYEKGFEEARLTEAIEAVKFTGLRVVMPPTAEIVPSSPSPMRTLLFGLVGGLVLGAALILLQEYRAHSQRREKPEGGPLAIDPTPESRRVDVPRNAA